MQIPKQYLYHRWLNLSHSNRKTIKICLAISMLLFSFYWGKILLIRHFIGEFLKQAPVVDLTQAKITPWSENYHTAGQLKALQTINISPQAPGIIKAMHIEAGRIVERKKLLIQLEDRVEAAQYKVELAEFVLQKKLFAQQKQLWQKHIVSESQYLQSKANLAKAKASMKVARGHLREKKIRASFNGVIGIPEVHVGQFITPGQQHIASLQQINQLYLDFHVPEKYFHILHSGFAIAFKTDNQSKYPYTAKILAIEPSSDTQAHTIWVRALVDNDANQLIPGLFVHLKLPTKHLAHAVTIPTSALSGSSKGPVVFVAQQKINPNTKKPSWWVTQRLVDIGLAHQDKTLILAGLHGNEWLVSSGTQKVHDASWANQKSNHK